LTDKAAGWVADASVWIGALLPIDAHHATSRAWLDERMRRGEIIYAPDLLLVELAGGVARRTGDKIRTGHLVAALRLNPHVRWVALDEALRDRAAQLAIDLRLRGADAVYVATAQQLGVPLVTFDDEQLERAGPAVTVRTP